MLAFFIFRFFSLRLHLIMLISIILAITATYIAYTSNEIVQRQVENRIITPSQGRDAFLENIYYNNREVIYMDYFEAGKSFFPIGIPPNVFFVERYAKGQLVSLNSTDVSLLNIFFRFGIILSVIYISIWIMFYRYISSMKVSDINPWGRTLQLSLLYSLPFMALASLNDDLLVCKYSVLFIILLSLSLCAYSSNK